MIILSKTHLSDIQTHGKDAYPNECCGAMLGTRNSQTQVKEVIQIIRLENITADDKQRHFAITDKDYQQLEKQAESLGLTLLGFYHTHPDHPAKPSPTDLSYAWPFFSYIILAVHSGKPKDINSFELDLDSRTFKSESLQIQ